MSRLPLGLPRLLEFAIKARRIGRPLGGHNVQAVIGAPDQKRRGLNEEVALWLDSGWWVTLRNQFAQAPDVAVELLGSVADDLAKLTARLTDARGQEAKTLSAELFARRFEAIGPDYWR